MAPALFGVERRPDQPAGQATTADDALARVGLDVEPRRGLVMHFVAAGQDVRVRDRRATFEVAEPRFEVVGVFTDALTGHCVQSHGSLVGLRAARLAAQPAAADDPDETPEEVQRRLRLRPAAAAAGRSAFWACWAFGARERDRPV